MPAHIKPFDNKNKAIVDRDDTLVPRAYMNIVRLKNGEKYISDVPGYETVIVPMEGSCDITIGEDVYLGVGKREILFDDKPDGVYVPSGSKASITGIGSGVNLVVAGGRTDKQLKAFRVTPGEVDKVQYGSDDTKTHRKIYHILGPNQVGKSDRLLVSELFTVGAGGWSGFPPHKHDEDREGESAFEEVYYFRFDPAHGFGAQFAYVHEDDFGPVHHIKDGSTIVLDKGYHPVVAAPGYRMYYLTILVGKSTRTLLQSFEEKHAYQLETIPGIGDMIKKFKDS
ncbi:MAG: myo-inositol catabolism IolB protein [Spirochaetes bacterium]|nr:MAG: myo-inositol catabolism IolB protein [Spirochaetota bacterium]